MAGTTLVKDHIEDQRVKWFGRLIRMNPEQPPDVDVTGKRLDIGREDNQGKSG